MLCGFQENLDSFLVRDATLLGNQGDGGAVLLLGVDLADVPRVNLPPLVEVIGVGFPFFLLTGATYNRRIMIELLTALIQAESTPEKGELASAQVISGELSRYGIDSTIDNWDSTRANIVARIKSGGSGPALLFAQPA